MHGVILSSQLQSSWQCLNMSARIQPVQSELPADVWGAIARATLRAEGNSVHAWERLCRVCRTWRVALTGAYNDGPSTWLAVMAVT